MPLSRVQSTRHLKRDYEPPGGSAQQQVLASKTGMQVYDSVLEAHERGFDAPTRSMEMISPAESHKVFGRSFVFQRFNGREI